MTDDRRRIEQLENLLFELRDYFDQRADADYNGSGFVANEEMRIMMRIDEELLEMYVLEHSGSHRDEYDGIRGPWVTTLWEVTAANTAMVERYRKLTVYERIDAARARLWVRQGGHHMTPLYIDWNEGRATVRYGKDT